MFLKALNLGHEIKCTCDSCKGTGIYKSFTGHLGIICNQCNGKGYYTLELEENMHLVQDEKKGNVYKVVDGIIAESVSLFSGLKKVKGVNYVIYSTGKVFSKEYLFEHGANDINVISYEEFMKGELPLPMVQFTCPKQMSLSYGNADFDNDCGFGCYSNCEKFGTEECWNKFYGDAKTIEEKQKVLKKIK